MLKVSIIILTYKKFNQLKRNIQSILQQIYENIEVIVSDDGSPNFNEAEIISYFSNCEPNISYKIISRKSNIGTVKNFNEAIKQSTGEIIIPLSEDDYFFSNDVVMTIVEFFKTHNCLICTARRIGEISKTISPNDKQANYFSNKEILLQRILFGSFISGSVIYYHRDLFNIIGYFDERFLLLEDYPMIINVLVNKVEIFFLNKITIVYGEEGVSNQKNENINPKLLQDFKQNNELYILKNINLVKSKKLKRYIMFRNELKTCRNKLVVYVENLPIILCIMYARIKNYFHKDSETLFKLLLKG